MAYRKNYKPSEQEIEEKRLRVERITNAAKRIRAMSDEEKQAFCAHVGLVKTIEGRTLSVFNTCLLASQLPTVSVVGGFRQWQEAGQKVSKGAKAVYMYIPCMPKEAADSETDAEGKRIFFKLVPVFDITATESAAEKETETIPETFQALLAA